MRTLTTTAVISADHTLTVEVPADIPPGARQVVIVLEDAAVTSNKSAHLELPPPHPVAPADPTGTYRREDLYGDDGR